jgi:sugar lactone lactonase YvrE
VRAAAEAKFASAPKASRAGGQVKISFTASAATDVEIAVLDAKGVVIRHLAAGLLGKSAPVPFKKNSLAQEIIWDGRADGGKPAAGGPFKVRVRLGSQPKLEKHIGWDPNGVGGSGTRLIGMAVGKGGELFVADSTKHGRFGVRVFDRAGTYLRTIMPYPANTPAQRLGDIGQLEGAGKKIPVGYCGRSGNVYPLCSGMKRQTMAFNPKGHLVIASAVGNWAVHGPPRHFLALHPEGGAPEGMSFVGPEIKAPRGYIGGNGEEMARYFEQLAVDPAGEYVYFTSPQRIGKQRRHCVFRVKWTDKSLGKPWLGALEPGAGDARFNDPKGLATDKDGNVYVADRGNNRVAVFSSEGKPLGKFAVEHPEMIAVHAKSGDIYIVSRKGDKKGKPVKGNAVLRKLSPFGKNGAPRELAQLPGRNIILMALDQEDAAGQLWIAYETGWGKPAAIAPITFKAGKFEAGEAINGAVSISYPLFMAADPSRERVLVREGHVSCPYVEINGKGGIGKRFKFEGKAVTEIAFDREGNIYTLGKFNDNKMFRFKPDGSQLTFPATANGITVGHDGRIYVVGNRPPNEIETYTLDGKLVKHDTVAGLGISDSGVAVDAAGNIYVGINLKKSREEPFPREFIGQVPLDPWMWWKGNRGKRTEQSARRPWYFMDFNYYLFQWGAVMKFPPSGGALYGNPQAKKFKNKANIPLEKTESAPAGAVSYFSGYLNREVRAVGAEWRYFGFGNCPASHDIPTDPGCICNSSRFTVDPWGRVYMPNHFRFTVEMLDTAGNRLDRIGRYGTVDDKAEGGGSDIPMVWPICPSWARGKLYVLDQVNRRVSVVRFDYAAEATCAVQ